MRYSPINPNPSESRQERPLIVSFSGIDGAGKTTQIDRLVSWLRADGFRVQPVRFWDDVATLKRLREGLGYALFKGEHGVGAPGKPVQRRDKNVQPWYMLPVRLGLYSLDALALSLHLFRMRQERNRDVIVFDRYVYDELANLDTNKSWFRAYSRWLLRVVPAPDVAFLLDANPVLARERKPEYPLEFLHTNRARYRVIAAMAGLCVINPGGPDDVELCIRQELANRLSRTPEHAAAA